MRKYPIALFLHALLLVGISIIVIAPIRYRTSLTPPGTIYTYEHRIPEDYYFYLMVIRQGREGFREYDQYTTEPTNPTAMHLYYLFLGQIGNVTGLSDIALYYVGMIGGLTLFYIFAYKLASLFFNGLYRFVALAIGLFASPFPPIDIILFGTTVKLGTSWWTNMDPYSRLTQVPHHFMGQALLLGATYCGLRFLEKKTLGAALTTAIPVALGLLIYSVPLVTFLLTAGLVLIFFAAKSLIAAVQHHESLLSLVKRHEKILLGIGIIAGIAGICLLFVQSILANTGWPWSTFLTWEANWYNHKIEIYPYTIGVYLLSFGILPIGMLPAFVGLRKKMNSSRAFVACLFITPILLYLGAANHFYLLPKIRFVHTAPYVFGGLLATYGIQSVVESFQKKQTRRFVAIAITGLFLLNIFLGLKSYWWPEFQKYEVYYNTYIPRQYFSVIEYLNKNTPPFSNVFASYTLGVYLPAFTKNNVFVGHMVSTANFWTKYSEANSFFSHDMTEEYARELFRKKNISYVFGEEPGLGKKYENILEPLYSVDNLTLYKAVY